MTGSRGLGLFRRTLGLALVGAGVVGAGAAARNALAAAPWDPASVNVCQSIPGEEVAKALGKRLKEAHPFSTKARLSRCTYLLSSPGAPEGPTEGFALWLYGPDEYDALARFTEGPATDVTGIGDKAILFRDPGDGRYKLRAVRRGRFTLEATAPESDSARKLADLAIRRLAR
jgi:hypothetical protein